MNEILLSAGIVLNSVAIFYVIRTQKRIKIELRRYAKLKTALAKMFSLDLDELINETND